MPLMRASLKTAWLFYFATALGGCDPPPDAATGRIPREVRVCAGSETVEGIDVSYYQGGSIDWNAVAGDGYRYAFIRVSHGINIIDTYFDRNWAEVKKAGLIRGAYQYFVPSQDAAAQAQVLLDNMGPLQAGDLPPVIDVEQTDGMTGVQIAAKVQAWIDHIEANLGVTPIIYTGKYFWEDNVGSGAFVSYPLWLPYYEVVCPNTPSPWTNWVFWQWTSTGKVAGIPGNVDLDIFNGSLDELKAMTYGCGNGVCDGEETSASCSKDCVALSFVTPLEGETRANPVVFAVSADASVKRVDYLAEIYNFGSSTDAQGGFEVSYSFNKTGKRRIAAEGFDGPGKRIAAAYINITVTESADGGLDAAVPQDAAVDGGGDASYPSDGADPSDSSDAGFVAAGDGGEDVLDAPDGSGATGPSDSGAGAAPAADAGPPAFDTAAAGCACSSVVF
jgi:lysozyme